MAQIQLYILVSNMDQLSLEESRIYIRTVQEDLAMMFSGEKAVNVFAFNQRALTLALMLSTPKLAVNLVNNPRTADCVLTVPQHIDAEAFDLLIAEHDLPSIEVQLPTLDTYFAWENKPEVISGEEATRRYNIKGIEPVIKQLLPFIDVNHHREGLRETPHRVAKAWSKWTEGYSMDAAAILKAFEDGAENCDEMVIVKDIPIYSKCEHHLADIFGTVTIAYIPNGKIAGLSKLSRVANMYARRLQVQERLTNQIADALELHLGATGVGVIVRARHMCMESRGICQQGHHTITSALRGVLKDNPETRAEFMALANSPVNI